MQSQSRCDFTVAGIEHNTFFEQAMDKLRHVVGRVYVELVVFKPQAACRKLRFRFLKVETRARKVVERAGVIEVALKV